jgi:OmpA-OmpF porin, OOP family
MRPGTNHLLMLLVGAMLAGCAGQTERSSSGSGSTQTQAQTPATDVQPEADAVQLVDRALDPVPEPPVQDIGAQPDPSISGPTNEQARAKPDLVSGPSGSGDETDEVADLGSQPDESGTEQYDEEQRLARQNVVGAPAAADEDADEVADVGTQTDESGTEQYSEEERLARQNVVGAPEAANEDADEVEDVGTQADESGTEQYDEEQRLARQKLLADPNAAEEESDDVADVGTQPDESGTVQHAEEQTLARQNLLGAPAAPGEDSDEVADVGTQPDESGTVRHAEEQRLAKQNLVGAPAAPGEDVEEVADVGTQADTSGTVQFPQEPRKVAQVVGAPTQVITVSSEAEPLFGFNQSVIRPDQRGELNDLVASLKGAKFDTIEVVGHADRIGSTKYNQSLSERRARAVKAYLVGRGIPAKKIAISGRGENEPHTGTMCDDKKGRELISCLQPDRRVEVKVSGTKNTN